MGETPTGTGTAAPAAPTRIFLPDAHEVVRRGLRDLLESEADRVVEHRHVRPQRGPRAGAWTVVDASPTTSNGSDLVSLVRAVAAAGRSMPAPSARARPAGRSPSGPVCRRRPCRTTSPGCWGSRGQSGGCAPP